MTKKEAASRVYFVAKQIHDHLGGDDDADVWVMLLTGVAHDLDPANTRYFDVYVAEPTISKRVKLRRLIDHPATPQPEREAALRALNRMGVENR